MSKHELKIDWATHKAAKYACENWHYSKCLPSSLQKRVAVGAWEKGSFIGVVVFGHGANPQIGSPYGLTINQCVELTRIALKRGHKSQVSRIVKLALKFLKSSQPGLRLVVSYADQGQGHHGGVYQAGNWIYRGLSASAIKVWYKGKWAHKKTVDDAGVDQRNLKKKRVQGKHTYLMPLDKEMKKAVLPLSKPYPKRAGSVESDTPAIHAGEGGANPTPALHSSGVSNG